MILNILRKNEFQLLKPKNFEFDINEIRLEWLTYYGMVSQETKSLPTKAHCHLLGTRVPLKYLNGSHLFQKRWYKHVRDFGLSSINSPKNVLILLKIFQEAFASGQFVLVKEKDDFCCKILDDQLRDKNLHEAMKDTFPDYNPQEIDFNGKVTFGDFEGQKLFFLNEKLPYIHCLLFHALVARETAFGYGWIDNNYLKELDDMWPDGLAEKTKRFIEIWRITGM
jgi:hypothetical protein